MKLIGVVGGIGSGKSLISRQLQALGAEWVNADAMVHEVYRTEVAKGRLKDRWGLAVFDTSGEVDRGRIAEIVFESSERGQVELEWLEGWLHAELGHTIRHRVEELRAAGTVPAVVLDAPVLLKAGWDQWCDELLFVECPAEERWRRVSTRGWSRVQWEQREALQTPLQEKRSKSTFVINNGGSVEETSRQLQEFWSSRIKGTQSTVG